MNIIEMSNYRYTFRLIDISKCAKIEAVLEKTL